MGNIVSLAKSLFERKKARVVMVGLDSAGKTTILNSLKFRRHEPTVPTIGFNVDTVSYKNVRFDVWDLGGQDTLRPLWGHYYDDADAVIFVVDSNDKERIQQAREALRKLLCENSPKRAPLLLYCNKQDTDGALSVRETIDQMNLRGFVGYRDWYVQGCSASTGDGLYEGLEWLSEHLASAD